MTHNEAVEKLRKAFPNCKDDKTIYTVARAMDAIGKDKSGILIPIEIVYALEKLLSTVYVPLKFENDN